MQARIRKAMKNEESGFTLIELLVVMLIIGILSAIAIPVFMSQQQKARDTAAKSDVSSIAKYVATYYVDGSGALELSTATVDGAQIATLSERGPGSWSEPITLSGDNVATGSATDASSWCVQVKTSDAPDQLTTDSDHVFKYTPQGMGEGVCPTP